MTTIAIIQSRMSASRLPGKVLLDISGKPMLEWVVTRVSRAESIDRIVIATTTDPSDDPIAGYCRKQGWAFLRGSHHDVLDRYVQAARQFDADTIVRLTADCPLIDPGLLDQTVAAHEGLDFAANRLPPPWGRSYPIGLDVEVVTRTAIETAWQATSKKHHREHVMPYFYDDLPANALRWTGAGLLTAVTPRGFKVGLLHHSEDHGSLRWTVDTPEDLAALRALTGLLPDTFNWIQVVEIWQSHPEIARINADIRHKTSMDVDERSEG